MSKGMSHISLSACLSVHLCVNDPSPVWQLCCSRFVPCINLHQTKWNLSREDDIYIHVHLFVCPFAKCPSPVREDVIPCIIFNVPVLKCRRAFAIPLASATASTSQSSRIFCCVWPLFIMVIKPLTTKASTSSRGSIAKSYQVHFSLVCTLNVYG